MQKDYLGTVKIHNSDAFTQFTKGICKTLMAEKYDVSVVEVINLTERIDTVNGTNTIAKSRAEQSRAEQSRAEQSRAEQSKLRLLAAWIIQWITPLKVQTGYMAQMVYHRQLILAVVEGYNRRLWRFKKWM